jgi:methyl-accepting chemotaxis protein
VGILAVVRFATNLLYGHSVGVAPTGTPNATGTGAGHVVAPNNQFDTGPALIGLDAAVIAVAGARWLAERFHRPLRSITTTAQEISANNLHCRLDLTGPNNELTDLGKSLRTTRSLLRRPTPLRSQRLARTADSANRTAHPPAGRPGRPRRQQPAIRD